MARKKSDLDFDKRKFAVCACGASTVHEPFDRTKKGMFDIYRCWQGHQTKLRRST